MRTWAVRHSSIEEMREAYDYESSCPLLCALAVGAGCAVDGASEIITSGPVTGECGMKTLWVVGGKLFQSSHLGSEAGRAENKIAECANGVKQHPRGNDNGDLLFWRNQWT